MTRANSPPGSWKRVWPALTSMAQNRRLHPPLRFWVNEKWECWRSRSQLRRFRSGPAISTTVHQSVRQAINRNMTDAAVALDTTPVTTGFPFTPEGTIIIERSEPVALTERLHAMGLSTAQLEGEIRVWRPRLMTDHWLAQEELAANIRAGTAPKDLSPVDAVVTWVDGSDPLWRARMLKAKPSAEHRTSANNSRFNERGQLRYVLRSIAEYTPWIRQIFLVTDGQRPEWLIEQKNLVLVDHREILPEVLLPTFSSHTIETSIHRIPKLSENFIYFNDDTFVGRPLGQEFFFDNKGRPIFARAPAGASSTPEDPVSGALSNAQSLVDPGGEPLARLDHSPRPLLRSTLYQAEEEFGEEFDRTRRSKFRSIGDISLLSQLNPHLLIRDDKALLIERPEMYINVASRWAPSQMRQLLHRRRSHTFTLNDTETPAKRNRKVDRAIARFLNDYFPYPSPWES